MTRDGRSFATESSPVRLPTHDEPLLRLYLEDLSIDHLEVAIANVRIRSSLLQFALETGAVDVMFRHLAVDDALPDLGDRRADVDVIGEFEVLSHCSAPFPASYFSSMR